MSRADDGLRGLIQHHLAHPPDWLATPVETGGTHSGVPDLYWAHRPSSCQGWIECKATTGWAVSFRPHQIGWAKRHGAADVRLVVAVRARGVGSAAGAGDSLWLLAGRCVPTLAEKGLRAVAPADVLGVWVGPPSSWDWAAVGRLLLG